MHSCLSCTAYDFHVDQASHQWKEFQFATSEEAAVKVAYCMRLEFQDGKRRLDNVDYGRGAVHLHGCIFVESIKDMKLEKKILAIIPEDPCLKGVVLDSQCDYKSSGIPLREDESIYDESLDQVLLHHPREAHSLHLRPYVLEDLS